MPQWQTGVEPEVEARILAAASHQRGDFVPIWDCIRNSALVNHFRRRDDAPHEAIARTYWGLGIDVTHAVSFAEKSAERGLSLPSSAQTEVTTPQQLEEQLHEYGMPWEHVRAQLLEEYRVYRDLLAPRTMFVPSGSTGFSALYLQVGLERFSYWIYEHGDLIEAVLDRYALENRRWAETAARERLCPLFLIGDDVAHKDKLLFSPAFLRRSFIPALRLQCEPLKQAGVKVIFHSDGNLTEFLDELIGAGIDGIHPIEPVAGMDIGYLKRRYGRQLILVGNVDCSVVLPHGSVGEVREHTRECLRRAAAGGGHFIGSSSEIGPAVPTENALAFYEACRRFGRYPLSR